jgi:hypothetical protein
VAFTIEDDDLLGFNKVGDIAEWVSTTGMVARASSQTSTTRDEYIFKWH